MLAGLSFALTIWRWRAARQFPLHRPVAEKKFLPAITLLKPLKGVDPETRRCLQSWFAQNYSSPVQILFGVASGNDPVCEIVRELMAANPAADARLVICEKDLGANAKVSTLTQLEPHIQHEIIFISDADVSVPPDFLSNAVQPLAKRRIGLVNCFYRLANPTTLAMRWEAIAINADFWSQVLQAESLTRVDFALGAVMGVKREQLKKIGGFAALADYLADDYQLGNQIARKGAKIVFASVVVDCWENSMDWKKVFLHQLRWARTIRICQPIPFFFSILNNATIWPLLFCLMEPMWDSYSIPLRLPGSGTYFAILKGHYSLSFTAFLFCAFFRVASAVDCQWRLTRSISHLPYFWLVPIKDLLDAAVWALSFLGNQIEWRGQKYKVRRSGKLEKLTTDGHG